ncbi:MAG: SpoIIE family protein phosphatase [Actinomycetota bacterium]
MPPDKKVADPSDEFADARAHLSGVTAQYAVARELASAGTIEETAPRVLRAILQNLKWEVGSFWLVDRGRERLRCIDIQHLDPKTRSTFAEGSIDVEFEEGLGLPGRVWNENAAVWVSDIQTDDNFPRGQGAAAGGLHAAMAFPIAVGDDVLGVMEFLATEILERNENLLLSLNALGSQIAQYVQRVQTQEAIRESEALKSAILDSALDCVISMDEDGRIIEFNPAAEKVFGYAREDVIGRDMADHIIPPDLREEQREGLRRYLTTGKANVLGRRFEIRAMRADGSEFPVEVAITRVDVPGRALFTGYIRDITMRVHAEEERARLLELEQGARVEAETVSRRLSQLERITESALTRMSLDDLLVELLKRLSEVLSVDTAAVELISEDRAFLTLRAVTGGDLERMEGMRIPMGEALAGHIAATGEPLIVENLKREGFESPVFSEGISSVVGVPLNIASNLIGVVIVGTREERRFTPEEVELMRLAADRMAIPIENARLFDREHRIANLLQRSLLPDRLPRVPGMTVASRYVAGGAGLMVGGDLYDVIPLSGGHVGVVIGDVVGRGVRAASVMGQLRNVLRAYAVEGHSPASVLQRVDAFTEGLPETDMATLVYLRCDPKTGTVVYTNAGHPPPLILRNDGSTEYLEGARSVPIATVRGAEFTDALTHLAPGETLLLYTDGLIEERQRSIDEGLDELKDAMARGPKDLEGLCDFVLKEILSDRESVDDTALVAVRLLPLGVDVLDLILPAEPNSLAYLRRELSRWLGQGRATEQEIFELTVASCEAAANAVEHAYGLAEADFQVKASIEDDVVTIIVRDQGRWRAPRGSNRGRGLQLIESLMDEMQLGHHEEGTEVRMTRRLAGGTSRE